jgi:hypothetical protein
MNKAYECSFIVNQSIVLSKLILNKNSTMNEEYAQDYNLSESELYFDCLMRVNLTDEAQDVHTYFLLRNALTWLSLVVVLIGLGGNLLSFLVLIDPNMRTTTNIYLSNLCISSFIALFGLLINSVFYEISYYYGPKLALKAIYVVYPYVYPIITTFQMACIMFTVCVSVNQFLCIYFSKAKNYSNVANQSDHRKANRVSMFVYMFSIVYCIPYWLKFEYTSDVGLTPSKLGKNPLFNRIVHFWLYLPIAYIIPFSVLTVTNAYLLAKLMIAKRRRHRLFNANGHKHLSALSIKDKLFKLNHSLTLTNSNASKNLELNEVNIGNGEMRKVENNNSQLKLSVSSEEKNPMLGVEIESESRIKFDNNKAIKKQNKSCQTIKSYGIYSQSKRISNSSSKDRSRKRKARTKETSLGGTQTPNVITDLLREYLNEFNIASETGHFKRELSVPNFNHSSNKASYALNRYKGHKSKRHSNSLHRGNSLSSNLSSYKCSLDNSSKTASRKTSNSAVVTVKVRRSRVTCMLIAVVFFFFICQFPNLIIHILQSMSCTLQQQLSSNCIQHNLYKYGLIISKFLLKINLSFNFTCYCLFGDKFREVLQRIFMFNRQKVMKITKA